MAERIPTGEVVHVESQRDGSAMSLSMPAGGLDEHWVQHDDEGDEPDDGIPDAEVVDTETGEVVG
jgi:hypothetical protein